MHNTERTETKRRDRKLWLRAAALTTLGAVGCAEPSELSDESPAPDTVAADELALQAPATQSTLRDPNGIYFADVRANGTGCPAGTWNTALSDDGLTFTTTFSAYEAIIDPTKILSAKDCQLTIKLHSPNGVSYGVQTFSYQGYAFLEEGVQAYQTANYYFQGSPVLADKDSRTTLVGPYDDAFLFKDEVQTGDTVIFSPCGLERELNVVTRLVVQNGVGGIRASGYANLTSVDAEAKLIFRLAVKKCTPPAP